jgi:hypothetical protein
MIFDISNNNECHGTVEDQGRHVFETLIKISPHNVINRVGTEILVQL